MNVVNDELLDLIAKHQLSLDWDSGDIAEEIISECNMRETKCMTATSELSGITYSLEYTDTEEGRREALNQLLLDSADFPEVGNEEEVEPHFAEDIDSEEDAAQKKHWAQAMGGIIGI